MGRLLLKTRESKDLQFTFLGWGGRSFVEN